MGDGKMPGSGSSLVSLIKPETQIITTLVVSCRISFYGSLREVRSAIEKSMEMRLNQAGVRLETNDEQFPYRIDRIYECPGRSSWDLLVDGLCALT